MTAAFWSAGQDMALAACLLAVDPPGLGGIAVRSTYGSAIEPFMQRVRSLLPADAPFRRLPLHITDGRLLGGLDLAMTLQSGRPVLERGLLAEADGGFLVLPMAERLTAAMTARLCSVLDRKEVAVERDGFALRNASHLAVLALDEGTDDERAPAALLDRLAIHLVLDAARHVCVGATIFDAEAVTAARALLPAVVAEDSMLGAFCHAAIAAGIASIRAPILAMKVARIHAALERRDHVNREDALVASRLVLAPRATTLPPAEAASTGDASETPDPHSSPGSTSTDSEAADNNPAPSEDGVFQEIVVAATRAAIPADVLARLHSDAAVRKSDAAFGRAGAQRRSAQRGSPAGTRRGELKAGARLNIVETLRAAAPWQSLRREQSGRGGVHIRCDDFRLTQFKRRSASATIFVVDASGSSALHRLAEAKGAVELLLANCYVRRDQVALIAFRGKNADLVLPPTRSLARAKRSLTALPGGGGTPIATALDAATNLAHGLRRKGYAPTLVVLTDGRANISRDGKPGREQADLDAIASAHRLRAAGLGVLLVDISPHPHGSAERLATNMGARYLALPNADARGLSRAVQAVGAIGQSAGLLSRSGLMK
ncbi:MAG: magnesium chelatase subunit D [Xanthobacteraceae bacterium]